MAESRGRSSGRPKMHFLSRYILYAPQYQARAYIFPSTFAARSPFLRPRPLVLDRLLSTGLGKRARSTVLSCLYQVSKNQRTVPPRRQKAADPRPGRTCCSPIRTTRIHTTTNIVTTTTTSRAGSSLCLPKILRGFNERRVSRKKGLAAATSRLGQVFL